MRDRIRDMRLAMVEQLAAHGAKRDFSFVGRQRGMFSYSGLTADQVERLKTEFGIYAVQHRPYLRRRAEQIEPGDHHQGHRPGPVGNGEVIGRGLTSFLISNIRLAVPR
ncbi:aminotransferase class I/II-fold pyridoxal phosphate-dependent enzyme [Pseudomonas aeruginosa]